MKSKLDIFRSAQKAWAVGLLLLILAVVTAIRVRLLNFPLERDEGEFAYAGQLLLQGISPYDAAYTAALKLPGTFVAYAAIMGGFGQSATAIHAGVILINLTTALLVFALARQMCGAAAGVVAAGTFALLAINPATLGLAAHATHFILLPALAGILLLQHLDEKTSSRKFFCAGLLLGLALIMKQTGAFFGMFAAVWVVWSERALAHRCWKRCGRRLGWLALGGLLPFLLTCGLVAAKGEFGRFWFWGFQYAGAHGAIFSFKNILQSLFLNVGVQITSAPGLWGLAILGVGFLFFAESLKRWRFFLISFAVFSFLAVCPGGYFRGHYFIQMLPAAGLLAAATFTAASSFFERPAANFLRMTPTLIFAAAMASTLIQWSNIFFFLTPVEACRAVYGNNPFPEALAVSRYLSAHCGPNATIAVLGSEPEIFFYSQRHSATGYICAYPVVEPQPYAAAMRQEMIRQIEQANPAYVIWVNIPGSWIQSTVTPDKTIFDWFERYRQQQLQLVGTVEILPGQESQYTWFEPSAALPTLASDYWLAIFKNRTAKESPWSKSN